MSLNQNSVNTLSAATKCTAHAEPGNDGYNGGVVDGVVSDNERYSQASPEYAIQKFYCMLAAKTSSPESVSGAVSMIRLIVCAIEKQVGSLPFDGSSVSFSSITFDSTCATAEQISNMGSTVLIPGGATVTTKLNPTFSEIPGNTHYTHGIKIVSTDPTILKFIIVAKFDANVAGNPVDSGDFEFATLGSGTIMQGSSVEYTAGKISGGTAATKQLWFESRLNRVKIGGVNDPVCNANNSAGGMGSCGFTRHVRLKTNIEFAGSDINNVSNLSGIITDGGDSVGSTQTNQMNIVTATGALSTGLTGKIYTSNSSPRTLSNTTLAGFTTGSTTCIPSSGMPITTSCAGKPAPLAPAGSVDSFFLPANTSAWLGSASTNGGIGFTGAATFADQFGQ